MASFIASFLWEIFLVIAISSLSESNTDAKRLYDDLLRKNGYNRLVRPVLNYSDSVLVKVGLRLSQLIDIDERNQVMTTNVWLTQEWTDTYLQWSPELYGNVSILYVPSDEIWKPDVVLFNNADGNYEVQLKTKANIYPSGKVFWEPPAIFKTSCAIDVEFFPFDEQLCTLNFGSWTYDGNEVSLKHIWGEEDIGNHAVDLNQYLCNAEWDILSAKATKYDKYYDTFVPYPEITFNISIRRKTLFHTVNLIIPCVSITCLTVLVFYLPSDSGEKVSLCICILLALTVFFLLLAEIIPPTSLVVPLIGKYLLFTMVLITLSIFVTVIVLNVHFRSPFTHEMSPWVRKVFLSILPRLLMMQRPHRPHSVSLGTNGSLREDEGLGFTQQQQRVTPQVQKVLNNVNYIAQKLMTGDEVANEKEDWKYVAMVLDRLFLCIFSTACIVGSFGIILQAPSLYTDRGSKLLKELYPCMCFHRRGHAPPNITKLCT